MSPHDPNVLKASRWLLPLCALGTIVWLWTCFCAYPGHEWNAMRLAPSVMWRHGLNPYPGPGEGPVTTWIYGPIPLLGNIPAAMLPGVVTSMLASDALNLLLVVVCLACAIHRLSPPNAGLGAQIWACAIAIVALQNTNFIFFQADNWVTACGLAVIAIIGCEQRLSRIKLWSTAVISVLALWCKPTALGPVLGLLIWIGLQTGWRESVRQTGRCLVCGSIIGLLCFQLFDPAGMIFNMFLVPSRIPMVDLWTKVTNPIFIPGIIGYLIAPAGILVTGWLTRKNRRFKDFSPGVWMFWLSIPFSLAGFATIGGNLNSFYGVNFLLPGLGVALGCQWMKGSPITREWLRVGAFGGLLLFQIVQIYPRPLAFSPQTQSLHQGLALARQLPNAVYFPWNPLLNFEIYGRFDHAEDGLLTRSATGLPINLTQLHKHLPTELCVIAQESGPYRGVLLGIDVPANAKQGSFGVWHLTYWVPPQVPTQPGASSISP